MYSGVERILAGKLHRFVTLIMSQDDTDVTILHFVQYVRHVPIFSDVTGDVT